VNIKIALSSLEKSGEMSRSERDVLLQEMENEVGNLVLIDNKQQTLALSIMEKSIISFQTELFIPLLEELEKTVGLKRKVEFLPSNQEIQKTIVADERLTRPELSVILSYSKMLVYSNLEKTKIVEEEFLEKYLIEYFPTIMREKFRNELLSHPLKNEIILTSITNEIVNRMGGPVIHSISNATGAKICDIVRSYILVSEIFNIGSMWVEIDEFDISDSIKIELYTELNKLLRRGVCWFLLNFGSGIYITELLARYKNPVYLVTSEIEKFLIGESKDSFNAKLH
jgi:glutamate dehydrogenase